MNKHITFLFILLIPLAGLTQNKDKAAYQPYHKGFYHHEILPALQQTSDTELPKRFQMQIPEEMVLPTSTDQFTSQWHNTPESQGSTGTCWAYAATSFLESEIYRITKKKVALSEMYFVYMDYVERTKHYVDSRGETYFNHGSEANAVTRMMKKYGVMPYEAFPGKATTQAFHDHGAMMKEMQAYLQSVKDNNAWNEKQIVNTITNIMEHYMGDLPESFEIAGKSYNPQTYLQEYLDFEPGQYFSFMSTSSKPFWSSEELVEPDNWWHSDNYYNLPLDDYYQLIDRAIDKGFTICICGDVSEPGHLSHQEVSMIPDFDIPSEYINQDSREMRLNNQSTTDDHCIHLVGHATLNHTKWYLIKDSGAGGQDGNNKGYRFFHEDYIKLKMMNILLHRDAATKELDQIIKKKK